LSLESRVSTLLAPTDSVRKACGKIVSELPGDLKSLRLYARPPVTFYLAGRIPILPQPDFTSLVAGESASWALVDKAMVWQQNGGQEDMAGLPAAWSVVHKAPTTLSLPALLDIDPAAAVNGRWDRSAPLFLLRRVRTGGNG
jgi:hypothetical protein